MKELLAIHLSIDCLLPNHSEICKKIDQMNIDIKELV